MPLLARISRSYGRRRRKVLNSPTDSRRLLAQEDTCRLRARARIELVANFQNYPSHAARWHTEQRSDVLIAQSLDQPLQYYLFSSLERIDRRRFSHVPDRLGGGLPIVRLVSNRRAKLLNPSWNKALR